MRPSGPGPPHFRGFTITLIQAYHALYDSSGRVISPTQRPLPDSTQHSQETDMHAHGGIGTRNPRKQSAADPRLRPRGNCDRPSALHNVKCSCGTVIYGVNILCQNSGSPLRQKQEISDTAVCLETAFYILAFYVLILYLHFNLNNV
jgi:hypothetical protein